MNPTTQVPRNAVLVFCRQDGLAITAAATLRVRTTLPNDKSIKDALVEVTSQWSTTTEQGRAAAAQARGTTNIGDLDASGAFSDEGFRQMLSERGVHDPELWVGELYDAIAFDEPLLKRNACQCSTPEAHDVPVGEEG